jgi:predicted DNA-binding transcriptional regulator AlpA
MTLSTLWHPITYWVIEIERGGSTAFFCEDARYVSAKGYIPTINHACFASKKDARQFLEINSADLHRRCGTPYDFTGFVIYSRESYRPIVYDEPVSLKRIGKRGVSRSSLYRNQMSSETDWDSLLTPPEAASRVRRSVRTLARMRAEGRGPKYHFEGGRILYPTSAITEWLSRHLVQPIHWDQ